MEDLEAIKTRLEKLEKKKDPSTPTTIGISHGLRDELKEMKLVPEETYENVIKRLIKDRDKLEEIVLELEGMESETNNIGRV